MTKAVQLLSQALELPESDRALMARELVLSLEDDFDADSQREWAAEILSRSNSLRSGRAKPRDAHRAVKRIRETLPRRRSKAAQ